MGIPLQVTFRHIDHSDAAEQLVREKAEKLNRFGDLITSCRVVIEAPHRSQNKGNHHKVTIDLTVPGREFVVDRDPAEHQGHEDLNIAIREAFDHAVRELNTWRDKERDLKRKLG